MNLVDIVKELGDKNYTLGRPTYHAADDEEYQPVMVHARPFPWEGKSRVIKKIISDKSKDSEGVAIAYGGFIGIDIAAAHDVKGVLLLDINPDQKQFWRAVIQLIKDSPTAESFRNGFSIIEHRYALRDEKKRDTPEEPYPSFVSDEKTYEKVRGWALNGMMAATDMDAMDTARHEALSKLLVDGKKKVSVMYLSNVPFFHDLTPTEGIPTPKRNFYSGIVQPGDYEQVFSNQSILAGSDTKVVHAAYDSKIKNFTMVDTTLGECMPTPAMVV